MGKKGVVDVMRIYLLAFLSELIWLISLVLFFSCDHFFFSPLQPLQPLHGDGFGFRAMMHDYAFDDCFSHLNN